MEKTPPQTNQPDRQSPVTARPGPQAAPGQKRPFRKVWPDLRGAPGRGKPFAKPRNLREGAPPPRARSLVWALVLSVPIYTLAPSMVTADTNSNMDAFFSGALGSATITGPKAYKGQLSNSYSGGSLTSRFPQRNLQLAAVQLPSISAGCGGIDIFAGGFSFINADALVAFMKAVASNAVGYAFNLALQQLCSPCMNILAKMQDIAQKINSQNISSCQAAETLVDTTFNRTEAGSHNLCSQLGTSRGYFSDMAQGWANCQANSTSQLKANAAGNDKNIIPIDKNIAWSAIQKIPYLANDSNFAGLVQTLTGTVVLTCDSDSSVPGGCDTLVVPAVADQKPVLSAILDGGSILGTQCTDGLGEDECLTPLAQTQTFTIAPSSGLRTKVQTLLDDIVIKVLNRQPLTSDEQALLAVTPAPILKMARVYTASMGVLAQGQLDQYADLIASTMTVYFVEQIMADVQAGVGNLQGVDKVQLAQWQDSLRDARASLRAHLQTLTVQESAFEQIVARTRAAEAALAGDEANQWASAYAFASGLGGR